MKFNLFYKELFGGRRKLIVFILVCIIVYSIVNIQIVLTGQNSSNDVIADLKFYGRPSSDTMITFNKFKPINNEFNNYISDISDGRIKPYNFIERNIITVQRSNSLENVTYTLLGVDDSFINDFLSNHIYEGRVPAKGKNEILVGYYIAQACGLNIGDTLNEKIVEFKSIDGGVSISFDLSGEFKKIEYTVVGIVDENTDVFDNSIIVPSSTQPNTQANEVWLYFQDKGCKDIYIDNIVNGNDDVFNKYDISGVSENYNTKNQGVFNKLLGSGYILVLVMIFSYLIISYILKGISKKLGILKALGISDKYIFKCYIIGVVIIQAISVVLSFLISKYVCIGLNNYISDFNGFRINRYSIGSDCYILMAIMFALITLSMFIVVKYRVSKVSPKTSMIENN